MTQRIKKFFLLFLLLACNNKINAQIITTVAGNGTASYSGDGGQAINAELYLPIGMTTDAAGNLYIADMANNRVRKISTSGIITTIAGVGPVGVGAGSYGGDGGPATSAQISSPYGVTFDVAGNLYIADEGNQRIRKIDTAGIISTIAGNGNGGFSGDGGPAINATFDPTGIAIDAIGNLYIADYDNNRIRMVNSSGIINTIAGNGTQGVSGDNGLATIAELSGPFGVVLDAAGNLYISDEGNARIRKVNTSGIISTIASTGTYPAGITLDAFNNLYIAGRWDNRIHKLDTLGVITSIAGNGANNYSGDGGQATAAALDMPMSITVDALGNLYISDYANNRIRFVCSNPDNISGIISEPNTLPVTVGEVYVYRYQPGTNAGVLDTAGFTTINSNGTYTFSPLPYGDYFIEAIASASYSNAISTYYSNKLNNYHWDSALVITHSGCTNTNHSGYNITVMEPPVSTGIGVVSGHVWKYYYSPLQKISVKLGMYPGGNCIACTLTDSSGYFSFTNVDTGSYIVVVDIPNFIDSIVNVHISQTSSVSIDNNFCVTSQRVDYCPLVTNVRQYSYSDNKINIYPNPTSDQFFIETNATNKLNVELYDVNGRHVLSASVSGKSNINVTSLTDGVYTLTIKTADCIINKKVVILH